MAGKYLDRVLKGIGKKNGRVQWPFGTDDKRTIDAMKAMVSTLYDRGDHGVLIAIEDKKTTLTLVYAAWKNQALNKLPIGGAVPFDPTAFVWLKSHSVGEKTKKDYREYFKALCKVRASFNVEDLPNVLRDYRQRCEKKGTARMFNATRNACRAFLHNYFEDKFHPLYLMVCNVKSLTEQTKNRGQSWTVATIDNMLTKMPPHARAQFWTMCITGAGMTEYQLGLTVEGNTAIRINGKKMRRIDDRRNRRVPLIEQPSPMLLNVQMLRRYLKEASGGTLKVGDARKCYSRWLQEAGVLYDHRMQYMGHAPQTMSDRYSRAECEKLWREDAALLKAYIQKERSLAQSPDAARNEQATLSAA
jgi:hypothetical protein